MSGGPAARTTSPRASSCFRDGRSSPFANTIGGDSPKAVANPGNSSPRRPSARLARKPDSTWNSSISRSSRSSAAPDGEQYLQRFYEATAVDGVDIEPTPADPDGEIDDVAFRRSTTSVRTSIGSEANRSTAWLDRRETVMRRFDLTGETLE